MPSRGVAPAVRVKREAQAAVRAQPSRHHLRAPAAVNVKTEVKLEASSTSWTAGVGGDAATAEVTTKKSQAGRHRDGRVGRRPPRSGTAVADATADSNFTSVFTLTAAGARCCCREGCAGADEIASRFTRTADATPRDGMIGAAFL